MTEELWRVREAPHQRTCAGTHSLSLHPSPCHRHRRPDHDTTAAQRQPDRPRPRAGSLIHHRRLPRSLSSRAAWPGEGGATHGGVPAPAGPATRPSRAEGLLPVLASILASSCVAGAPGWSSPSSQFEPHRGGKHRRRKTGGGKHRRRNHRRRCRHHRQRRHHGQPHRRWQGGTVSGPSLRSGSTGSWRACPTSPRWRLTGRAGWLRSVRQPADRDEITVRRTRARAHRRCLELHAANRRTQTPAPACPSQSNTRTSSPQKNSGGGISPRSATWEVARAPADTTCVARRSPAIRGSDPARGHHRGGTGAEGPGG